MAKYEKMERFDLQYKLLKFSKHCLLYIEYIQILKRVKYKSALESSQIA